MDGDILREDACLLEADTQQVESAGLDAADASEAVDGQMVMEAAEDGTFGAAEPETLDAAKMDSDFLIGDNNTLEAGDYIYLDVSAHTGWKNDSAAFSLVYGSTDKRVRMKVCKDNDNLFYAYLPGEIQDTDKLIILRHNPDGTSDWNPAGGGTVTGNVLQNLSSASTLEQLQSSSYNTLHITGWNAGTWQNQAVSVGFSVAGKTLYLKAADFPIVDTTPTIRIGSEPAESFEVKAGDNSCYYYEISPSSAATQDTIMTVSYLGHTCQFRWADLDKNMLTIKNGFPSVSRVYADPATHRAVYYDATLSKVNYWDGSSTSKNYPGGVPNNSIPLNNDSVYYIAWKSDDNSQIDYGEMDRLAPHQSGSNVFGDVWEAWIPDGYDMIRFGNSQMQTIPDAGKYHGIATEILRMPLTSDFADPCFYADSGDQSVYQDKYGVSSRYSLAADGTQTNDESQNLRGGIWDEIYEVRATGKNVAEIPGADRSVNHQKFYVNTTFYDYYSDWEINGYKRSVLPANDGSNNPGITYDGASPHSNRLYMPHRIFDMALSDYYSRDGKKVKNPLYFGHFQWRTGKAGSYNKIMGDLGLYGQDNLPQLFHNNNSEYRKEEAHCLAYDDGGTKYESRVATQGLASDTLKDDQLQLAVTDQVSVDAPFFNKAFLEGQNSYNAVIGAVYENVEFPFTRNQEGYWEFDSAQKTKDKDGNDVKVSLRLKQDTSVGGGGYFLAEETDPAKSVKGYAVSGPTTDPNFFPFNDAGQSGNVNQLNYAFGMKMDIGFHLTETGTINDTNGVAQPIKFNFSGDDDIWIFIDDELVLDIGGGHGVVHGELNFVPNNNGNMEAIVSAVKTNTSEEKNTGTAITDGVLKTLGDGGNPATIHEFSLAGHMTDEHRLTMFYMERGMWESNMKITFNFPQDNMFMVEKEVDASGLDQGSADKIFSGDTNVANNLKNLIFDYSIQNLATHYDPFTVEEMDTEAAKAGFVLWQNKISDYGSIASGSLQNVTGAKYSLYHRNTAGDMVRDGSTDGNKVLETTSEGISSFGIKDGQLVQFVNKFRRGSYLKVTERASSMLKKLSDTADDQILGRVFDTAWTMYDNNKEVTAAEAANSSGWVDATNAVSTLSGVSSLTVSDKRKENLLTGQKDVNGTDVTSSTTIAQNPPDDALLFRSYTDPDNEIKVLLLRAKYVNTVKTGNIAIKKDEGVYSSDLAGTEYGFTIVFDNVGGLKLEDEWDTNTADIVKTDRKITRTFTLKKGETKTFTGIPAGTSYTITETTIPDGSVLADVEDSFADLLASDLPVGVTKDTVSIGADRVVSGVVEEDTTPGTVQTFTFYNRIPLTTTLNVEKVDDQDTAIRLKGAVFTLVKWNTDTDTQDTSFAQQEKTTGADGIASFADLKEGTYHLAEQTAPDNYNKKTQTFYVVRIEEGKYAVDGGAETPIGGQTVKVSVGNTFKTGAIALAKAQGEYSEDLDPNTEYEFAVTFENASGLRLNTNWITGYNTDGAVRITKSYKVKKGSHVNIHSIPVGTTYTIREMNSPDASKLAKAEDSFSDSLQAGKDETSINGSYVVTGVVKEDTDLTQLQTFTFYNRIPLKTALRVEKVDEKDTGIKLANATFVLEKWDTATDTRDESFAEVTKHTGSDGVASFQDLEDGTYRLTETQAPDNYNRAGQLYKTIRLEAGRYSVDGGRAACNCRTDRDSDDWESGTKGKHCHSKETGG